jgi:2-(1,2-epoxy-1,2-dihydrophenyl)acetyl-CoA isomerase
MSGQSHNREDPVESIEVKDEGAVRYIRLNRPEKLNAMTPQMKGLLVRSFEDAARDPGVRCVVLTGNGRAFSAGGDITSMQGPGTLAGSAEQTLTSAQVATALLMLPKPVIAAVNGLACGSGFSLALACDILVASDTAWFSQMFRDRGLIPDSGSTYFLARQVGLYRAKEMVFSGRRISADEARDLGIVSRVWPAADFVTRAGEYAAELAAGPTVALGLAKRLIASGFETSPAMAIEREALAQGIAMSTEDHKASVEAFRAGRAPQFSGR